MIFPRLALTGVAITPYLKTPMFSFVTGYVALALRGHTSTICL